MFDTNGVYYSEWQIDNGYTYYYDLDGNMYKGIYEIDGKWYHFGQLSGQLKTGWSSTTDWRYYYSDENGVMQFGWIEVEGKRYYIDKDKGRLTGNVKINEIRYVFDANGVLKYSNVKIYADISSHQGNIDFDSLYNSRQIDGIILRIGYWTLEDPNFKYYISEIKRLNIPYSVYLFSYAHNSNEALQEANNMLSLFTKYQLNPAMNVYYDIEGYNTTTESSDDISKEEYQQIIETFINYLNANGIGAKVYSYYWYALNRFNDKTRSYLDWIAQYSENLSYPHSWRGWQYTDSGVLPGINNAVDLSIFLY